MIFRIYTNRFQGSESQLEDAFIYLMKKQSLNFSDDFPNPIFYRQVNIPLINRRSDIIVKAKNRLINIEFKLDAWKHVLEQAVDHLQWADYSYVAVPAANLEVFPNNFINLVQEKRLGLIILTPYTFVEIVRGKHNTYTRGKKKNVRNQVLKELTKKRPYQSYY
jgi:hypothetical protein